MVEAMTDTARIAAIRERLEKATGKFINMDVRPGTDHEVYAVLINAPDDISFLLGSLDKAHLLLKKMRATHFDSIDRPYDCVGDERCDWCLMVDELLGGGK